MEIVIQDGTRCRRHPEQVISNGQFDAPCPVCEGEMDYEMELSRLPQLMLMPMKEPYGLLPPMPLSHEDFIMAIVNASIERVPEFKVREKLRSAKITYGAGEKGLCGITYFDAWKNGRSHDFVTICANGESDPIQLADTVVHELGHVLAGPGCGHDKKWKTACDQLGLTNAVSGSGSEKIENFSPDMQTLIQSLAWTDGKPAFRAYGFRPDAPVKPPRPCPLGIGTRGGRSRGAGSGSRLRLWMCACSDAYCKANGKTNKVRAANDDMDMTCNRCSAKFKLQDQG